MYHSWFGDVVTIIPAGARSSLVFPSGLSSCLSRLTVVASWFLYVDLNFLEMSEPPETNFISPHTFQYSVQSF